MADFNVTTANDIVDANDGVLSLREAIADANATAGADTISFDASLKDALIRLKTGEIEITDEISIDGRDLNITITGDADDDDVTVGTTHITDVEASFGGTAGAADDFLDDNSRIFNISHYGATTSISGLTFTGGRTTGDGGAISSEADITITNSTISGNSSTRGGGGGIYGEYDVVVTNSTVSDNSTNGRISSGGGVGAGYDVTITGSTISGNSTNGEFARGGGVYAGGGFTIDDSTISGNSTTGDKADGGGAMAQYESSKITNSTITGNSTNGDGARGGGVSSVYGLELIDSIVLGNATLYSGEDDDEIDVAPTVKNGAIIGETLYKDGEAVTGTTVTAENVFFTTDTIDDNGRTVTYGVLADNGGSNKTIMILSGGHADDAGSSLEQRDDATADLGALQLRAGEGNVVPVANDDTAIGDEDTPITLDVLTNDSDRNNDTLEVAAINGQAIATGGVVKLVSGATVTLNANKTLEYTSTQGLKDSKTDTDSFEYTVDDGNGGTATATATVTINGLNDAPDEISLSSMEISEAAEAGTEIGDITVQDPDIDDSHTLSLIENADGLFALSDNRLVLAEGAELDFETNNQHNIVIEATDAAGATIQRPFDIRVLNEDEGSVENDDTVAPDEDPAEIDDTETPDEDPVENNDTTDNDEESGGDSDKNKSTILNLLINNAGGTFSLFDIDLNLDLVTGMQLEKFEELLDEPKEVSTATDENTRTPSFAGSDGKGVLFGSIADFNGRKVTDMNEEDTIIITNPDLERSMFRFDRETNTVSIDGDGDRTADMTLEIEGDFANGELLIFKKDGHIHMAVEKYLSDLEEGISLDPDQVNGIINQDFLTGDGEKGFALSLRTASTSGFDNTLGVYEIAEDGTIQDVKILAKNTNSLKGDAIEIGDVEAGHKLGFFLVQDGADWANSLAESDALDFVDAAGNPADIDNDAPLTLAVNGADADVLVFHSFAANLNEDGLQHTVSGVDENGESITIGFEDMTGGGDRDYQDVVFTVNDFEI